MITDAIVGAFDATPQLDLLVDSDRSFHGFSATMHGFSNAARHASRTRCGRRRTAKLLHLMGCLLARQERVIGVVVFPFAIPPRENDIMLCEPVTNCCDVVRPSVIVNHVRVRQM